MPFRLGPMEHIQIDLPFHTLGKPRARILPEHPAAAGIDLGGVGGDGAEPEGVVLELAAQVVAVEVGRGVDDRALAVVALQLVHEDLHLFDDALG